MLPAHVVSFSDQNNDKAQIEARSSTSPGYAGYVRVIRAKRRARILVAWQELAADLQQSLGSSRTEWDEAGSSNAVDSVRSAVAEAELFVSGES